MTRLSFYPVFGSYLLVVAAALVLLGLLALGPACGRASGRKRAALIALRTAVLTLMILAMLRPAVVYTEVRQHSATLVLLLDQSRSMSVPDAIGGKTRWDELRETVADAEDALAALAADFELKAYTFDAKVHAAKVDGGKISLPETPQGKQTAIGDALDELLGLEAGKRLLAVILESDGAQRTSAADAKPPQTAARTLKSLGSPLFTVAFGQSRGLGQAQDVAVKELLVNQSVFVKNELAIAGQVRVDGYVNREIPVNVFFETAPGKMEEVARQTLRVTDDSQLLPIQLSYAPQVPGEYKLTLEAVGQPGELVATNNRLSTFVNVLGGGLNVRYLEGTLRREIRFLRRALDASPDINVDYAWVDPQRPETRPGNMSEWFQPGNYDVYILGDLDSTAFRGNELEDLRRAVEQGAGLIMLGGVHSFGPGGYATTPLADVLPVKMNRFERQEFNQPTRPDVHVPGPLNMRPTRFGLLHFALMLAGDRAENVALWAKLPPLTEGANRFRSFAPDALVLADAGPNVPLLVAHSYGNGRVMAFAGDSTWRWQMHGYGAAHKRFWRQVVLWLARKDQLTDGNVWVRLAKRRFAPFERVEFTMGAQSAGGEPIADADYEVQIVLPDRTRRSLQRPPIVGARALSPQREDQMTGSFRQTQAAGDYAIEVTATHEGTALGTARARFLVFEQDLELDNAAADTATLEGLAAISGGQSLAPEELPQLIERLAQQTESLQVQQETKKNLWTKSWYTWAFFLVLVGLMGVEWYLRKRWGLV